MGAYPEGFTELETSDPGQIRATLTADCQVQSVHVFGRSHLKGLAFWDLTTVS